MPRRLALLLGVAALVCLSAPATKVSAQTTTFVGPTRILLVDPDTVLTVVTREWLSAATRDQEKLLRHGVRMLYWRAATSPGMREGFCALGGPRRPGPRPALGPPPNTGGF